MTSEYGPFSDKPEISSCDIVYDLTSYQMRLVLDTSVVVAALSSPAGASAALVEMGLSRKFTLLMSVALALEYESVCNDPAQRIASGLSESDVRAIISAMCAVSEQVRTHFLWRPLLRDPGDEMVLEASINGRADGLVTFNQRDFGDAPVRFRIALLTPGQALRKLER